MPANSIKFTAVLAEARLDRYGKWRIILEMPEASKDALVELSKHTEKTLEVEIVPPSIEGTFGRVQE